MNSGSTSARPFAARVQLCAVALCGLLATPSAFAEDLTPPAHVVAQKPQSMAATIGRHIFTDTSLSHPRGQGCISCHNPRTAFADARVVSPGAFPGRVGTRNAPSLMYAALTPSLAYEDFFNEFGQEEHAWEGGLFHDGRAQDQFAQVQEPFFDPNEMNIPDEAALAAGLRKATYAKDIQSWIGDSASSNDAKLTYYAYRALVEFLKEPLFRPFDARIDDYLRGEKDALSETEKRGLSVFENAGKCASCHLLEPMSWPQALLSDFGYDNLGVPARGKKDPGLAKFTKEPSELGQFKAPSLRNVALTAPYMHNGSIATLKEVMEFYNKRDLEPKRWGPTHYPKTVNREDLGNLGLTDQQVADLTALMHAFTDRSLLSEAVIKGRAFPKAPPGVPSTEQMKLRFPDWTHRLHPAFPRNGERPE